MRTLATKQTAINQYNGFGNQLWDISGQRPTLDLRFAEDRSLVDATTGSNLVDFTRASSGTYVGSDGLIKTAVTNLTLRSQEFANAVWTKNGSSITSDAVSAPDGTLTADKLVEDSSTGTHSIIEATATSYTSGVAYTFSFFVKKSERQTVRVLMHPNPFPGTVAQRTAVFNSNTGAFVSVGSAYTSSSVTAFSDGWYRVSLSSTADATSTGNFDIALCSDDAGTTSYTGNGTSGIYVWGAQLEQSTTVGEYVKTTSTINSAPRFDHDPTTGESLGLLVEESRTNLFAYSDNFNDPSWTINNATITSNTATAPDGTNTADLYSGTSTSAVSQSASLTSGVTYTISCYVKSAGLGNDSFRLRIEPTQTSSNFTATSEWQRFSFTATSANTGLRSCGILRNSSSDNVDIFIWGAQLEVGSFPTSYIPTTSSTVTRAADVASISGSNFSSWYRQDEGTVFAEAVTATASANGILSLNDGTNNESVNSYRTATNGVFQIRDGNVTQAFLTGAASASLKMSGGIGIDNFAAFANAVSLGVDNSGTLPSVDRLSIGGLSTGNYLNGTIRRLTYWPARLPNEVLQTITL